MFTISLQPSGLTLARSALDLCCAAAGANIVKTAMFKATMFTLLLQGGGFMA